MTSSVLASDLSTTTVVVDFDERFDAEPVGAIRASGAAVVVVAAEDGLDAEARCRPLGVQILTNPVDPDTGEVTYPYDDRRCPCATCGICKQALIKDATAAGRATVLVSARLDDRKAVLLADVIFAAGPLAAWCRAFDVPHREFTSLADVRDALVG